jgi:hypothetical protein
MDDEEGRRLSIDPMKGRRRFKHVPMLREGLLHHLTFEQEFETRSVAA